MTPEQTLAVLDALQHIDQGVPAPLLGGEPGQFLSAYARERRDAELLAFSMHVPIRKDQGAIELETSALRLLPLPADKRLNTFKTGWGSVSVALALCPELLSTVALRLWHSAYSAREAIREIQRMPQGVLGIQGRLRWLPPGEVTAGDAQYVARLAAKNELWQEQPFLLATGDDLYARPHALDYVVGWLGDRFEIAHIRSFILKVMRDGEELVPGGSFDDPVPFRRRAGDAALLRPGLWFVLASRTPAAPTWRVLAAERISATVAAQRVFTWLAFRDWLRDREQHEDLLVAKAQLSLRAVGEEAGPLQFEPTHFEATGPIRAFARALHTQMRLG